MAKNAPVKKSKRKLKRSVRRSIAAVLMITAIGVAAVPVPENIAAPEGLISPMASTDLHSLYSYVSASDTEHYKPDVNDEKSSNDINLSRHKTTETSKLIGMLAKPEEQAAAGKLYQSLNITRQGNDWMLRWEFIYYLEMHPVETNLQGVICRYNDSYAAEEVGLTLNPNTEYYTVKESDFDNYFMTPIPGADETTRKQAHNAVMTSEGMNKNTDPIVEMVFTYAQWSGDEPLNDKSRAVQECLMKYFTTDWEDFVGNCNAYPAAKDAWDKADQSTRGDAPKEPELRLTPATRLLETNPNLRYTYFCEYSTNLAKYGKDYELVKVQDGTNRESSSTSSYIYVVHSEKPEEIVAQYPDAKFDKNGFLVTATGRPVCAIGDRAFSKVANVDVLTLPTQIGYIGDEAFQDSFIKEIEISSVEFLGNRAFQRCPELSKVTIGNGTKVIGAECFESTPITTLSLPYSVSTIGYGAFANCRSLTTLNLNSISTSCIVKEAAFYNCSGLTSVQMDSSNIRSLGKAAFAVSTGSNALSMVLPPNIESKYTYQVGSSSKTIDGLGDHLFAGRTSLTSVIFPKEYGRSEVGAVTVPPNMFHSCSNLQYVEFPADWKTDPSVGAYATYGDESEQDPDDNKYVLFADVLTENFYVRGPENNPAGTVAGPRQSTWSAKSGRVDNNFVPYVYTNSKGVEFYEISDGTYLMCVDDKGILVSCKLVTEVTGGSTSGDIKELIIPSQVGNIKVTGIATGCFSDKLAQNVLAITIEDDSITEIGDAVFMGTDEKAVHPNRWQKLTKVYIGNSVNSIGADAFKDCKNLVDVTFASPKGGHAAFKIGTNAFKTDSPQLTFHGDIVEGYAPFDWAMDPNNVIEGTGDNANMSLRICYKSLAPTYLTVMYNPVTDMVTLLDYPKFSEIDSILNEEYADEINETKCKNYQEYREYMLYQQYSDPRYDGFRKDFADAWLAAGEDEETRNAVYNNNNLYGPWITPDFCKEGNWKKYISTTPNSSADSTLSSLGSRVSDFFFEPIVAYAAEEDPTPFYSKNHYIVSKATPDNSDPFFPYTSQEQGLVSSTLDIVIPAGVESIDVFGYVNNLTQDGEKSRSGNNNLNYTTYLRYDWDSLSRNMYELEFEEDEDGIRSVPGLFSGYYKDGEAAISEKRERGNDVIRSVTMNSVRYLPNYAFDSCENLGYVILGESCSDIGKAPFRGCYAMTTVGDNAYYTTVNGIIYRKDEDGTPITIEECLSARGNLMGQAMVSSTFDPNMVSVTEIKPGAFEDCNYLTDVIFGSEDVLGLKVIPEDCFKNCDILNQVVLPISTSEIKEGAFVGANRLTNLTVYGKEVQISAKAFDKVKWDKYKTLTTVNAYEDSAVVRYVGQYGDDYGLRIAKLDEQWEVYFYDADYKLIENLKDRLGNPLNNPQHVADGKLATEPAKPVKEGWTFERWVGVNNVQIGEPIYENSYFYAQGYSESGMVNGKYPVSFWDGVDGSQVGPMQYVEPGEDAIKPGHPEHAGYEPDGESDSYTNIQSPKTIILKYKPIATSGGGTNTPGTTSGSSTGTTPTPSTSNNTTSSSNNTTSSTTSSSSNSTSTPSGMYTVTVINGSGSGNYAAGATVLITANTPAAGSVFNKWVTESQGVALASVSTSPTTFTMPANNVTITAEFTAATTPASNSGSTGNSGGTTGNGNTRVDITKPGISNKDLATANVNGSTDNFIVKITETDEATRAVQEALTNKYGSLESLLYYAMDISLYDSTGTYKITDTSGLSVDITIPIPDALVMYGGNNMAGAVINGNQLESLNESFTTINGVPCIRFTATHFSPYTVYVDTGNLTEGMLDMTPKTGDPIHPKWFLSIGLACLSIILFMKKDKAVKVKTA